MKRFIKFLSKSLCLIFALVLSVSVVACDNKSNTGGNFDEYLNTEDYADNIEGLIEFGTHQYVAPETENKWLVKDGTTEYKLVIPKTTVEAGKTYFNYSINELVHFFKEATNIRLDVVYDVDLPLSEQTHSANQHFISFDETTLFKSSGITNSLSELGMDGGKIWTKDNNIYIIGNTDRGSKNAMYTFLDLTFNFECYSSNTIVIDKNVTDLKLRDYRVIDIPDVEYQPTSNYEKESWGESPEWGKPWYHTTDDASMYGFRNRVVASAGLAATEILLDEPGYVPGKSEDVVKSYVWGEGSYEKYNKLSKPGGHNSVLCVPPGKWKEMHPEWYSAGEVQLCYTCGGDEKSLDELTSRFADMIKVQLYKYPVAEYPYSRSIDITIADDPKMCQCDECMRLKETYLDAGLTVRFFNIVAEKVRAWMDETDASGNYIREAYRRENLEIRHYAYLATEKAPAVLDSDTGEWVPIDDTVIMHENTCIKYANINADYQQSLFATDNAWVKDNFDAWKAVARGNIGYFMYNYNCSYHNYFYDGFDHYNTKGINYYLAGGRSYYYSENIHGAAATEWGALISYINAKLCYNSLIDSGKLITNWFNAQFGPAAGIMMELFNNIRAFNHNETVRNEMYKRFSIYNQVYFRFNWNQNTVNSWIAKCDEALAAIEHLKETNPDEWSRIAYNIEVEAFSPIYIQFSQNVSTMSAEYKQNLKNRLMDNVSRWSEFTLVDAKGVRVKTWLDTL